MVATFLFLTYAGMRCLVESPIRAVEVHDSVEYHQIAASAITAKFFYGGAHPPFVPLVYKLLGDNSSLIVVFQLGLSILSWSILAYAVARSLRTGWWRPFAVGVVFLLSLTSEIIRWDRIILSESISLSAMVLAIASWIWLLKRESWGSVAAVGITSVAWALSRDTNAYLLLPVALAAVVYAAARRVGRLKLTVLAVVFVAAFFGSQASADGHPRWGFPLGNVLAQRILANPAQLAFFANRGMPVNPALMHLKGQFASGDNGALWTSPDLLTWRRWFYANGKATYTAFLLQNPSYAIQQALEHTGDVVSPSVESITSSYGPPGFTPVLKGRLDDIFFPGSLSVLGLMAAAGLAGIAVAATQRRVDRFSLIPIVLLALAVPHTILVWDGDAMEIGRHGILDGVEIRLGLWLMLIAVVDAFIWNNLATRNRQKAPAAAARDSNPTVGSVEGAQRGRP
jgi:hypothetical protein